MDEAVQFPCELVTDTSIVFDGIVSVNTADVAVEGPLFAIVEPTTTFVPVAAVGEAVVVTPRSAVTELRSRTVLERKLKTPFAARKASPLAPHRTSVSMLLNPFSSVSVELPAPYFVPETAQHWNYAGSDWQESRLVEGLDLSGSRETSSIVRRAFENKVPAQG
jgi:hypothetical protein